MKTDERLQKDVMEELRWEPSLHASEIGVAVKDGVVTLTGEVDNYMLKMTTERATKRVKGVKVVVQEVKVNPSFAKQHTDAQIGQAIASAFEWHSEIPQEKLHVKVQDGWVTLDGEVDWNYQRQAAERTIETLKGIRGVSNLIIVRARVVVQDVQHKIVDAFKRNAVLDAQRIRVETNGNKVILRGKVHSWSERKEAEDAAWSAPGVLAVEDNLSVEDDQMVSDTF